MQNLLDLDPTQLLTVQQTAELLKSTPKTIYTYLCKSGSKSGKSRNKLPSHIYLKLGRKVLFIKPKLMEWLLSGAKMEKSA